MRRTLETDEASLGPNDPNVALRLNDLARLLQATNRLDEAKPLMRRALEIRENRPSEHPDGAEESGGPEIDSDNQCHVERSVAKSRHLAAVRTDLRVHSQISPLRSAGGGPPVEMTVGWPPRLHLRGCPRLGMAGKRRLKEEIIVLDAAGAIYY